MADRLRAKQKNSLGRLTMTPTLIRWVHQTGTALAAPLMLIPGDCVHRNAHSSLCVCVCQSETVAACSDPLRGSHLQCPKTSDPCHRSVPKSTPYKIVDDEVPNMTSFHRSLTMAALFWSCLASKGFSQNTVCPGHLHLRPDHNLVNNI